MGSRILQKDGGLSKSKLDMQRKTKYEGIASLHQSPRALTKGQVQVQNGPDKKKEFGYGIWNTGVEDDDDIEVVDLPGIIV